MVKNLPDNTEDIRDVASIPGSGRSPGEGNGNLFQYSCLENPMDRGAWRATAHGVSDRTYAIEHTCTHALLWIKQMTNENLLHSKGNSS